MVKLAICYWGIPRSISMVYESQKQHIFDILKTHNIEYDVYVHAWKTDINRVWDWTIPTPIDYDGLKLVNPVKLCIENQSEYLDTISFADYYYEHDRENEWSPELLKNHLCALESQKRCINMCIASNVKYDYIMFLRPDALIETDLPVEKIFAEFQPNTIILPSNNHYEGYNDRFAIVRFNNVLWYSHRNNEIVEFRKKHGRIVSEKFVKYIIGKYYTLKEIDFYFRLLRSDGSIM